MISKVRSAIDIFAEGGLPALVNAIKFAIRKEVSSRFRSGVPIYEREWDILVVLDGCRADLMHEVTGEYSFLSKETITSTATKTTEWMEKNFTEGYQAEMNETAYVAGNPNSAKYLDDDSFEVLDEVWRYAWDDSLGTILPRPLTDRAIDIYRQDEPERMIVHYMQPHYPFISRNDSGTPVWKFIRGDGEERNVWERLEAGKLEREEVWEGYRENLRYVLSDITHLLENVDAADVVITSDHGNAVGEFNVYGHPRYMPLKCLKFVPWIRTSANDTGEYQPSTRSERTDDDVQSRLKDLGYI